MVDHFRSGILDVVNAHEMIQISMDGPAVNWKFYELMQTQIVNDYGKSLINIGSCGLHILHNAFKAGSVAAQWNVSSVLSSLYYLFKDSPARREDYQNAAGTTQMPLKFVNHRWLENVPVCQRALSVWSSVEVYVQKVTTKELPTPSCKSYAVISEAVHKDKLIGAKMEFFCSIASILQPFLINYQTDKPMVPFITSDLVSVMKCLMRKFIKSDIIDKATSADRLVKIDIEDTNNQLIYKKIDIGFKAEEKLKVVTASDKQLMEFRMECKAFLVALLNKLKVKCPISYSLVRNLSCLNPNEMVRDKGRSRERFKNVVKLLIPTKQVLESESEVLVQQYNDFLDFIPKIGGEKFSGFDYRKEDHRLDVFFATHMSDPRFGKLLQIVKVLLTLSHGQASVERGFSVNKEIECENLQQQSIIAQRIICDHVRQVGGLDKVDITNQLLVSAASARKKYEAFLEQQRQKTKTEKEQRKRKCVLEEIEELKKRKKQVKLDHEGLVKQADKLYQEAEKKGKLTLLAQANANSKAAKDKLVIHEKLSKELDEKIEQLKKP